MFWAGIWKISEFFYLKIFLSNPPPRSQWGIIEMAFVCPSICPSITLSCPLHISWTLWKIFIKLWSNVRLSESMFRTHVNHANSRSRSLVKVMGLSLEFCVRSISPIPLEGFSLNFGHMFASVRWCAALITQPCWHKVKVTVQGHRFEPWISCPLCISYTSGRIFFKLWSNVHLSETMCRISNSIVPTQGDDHSSRSWVWALNFVSALYLLYPWEDFLKTLVKCSPQWDNVQNP